MQKAESNVFDIARGKAFSLGATPLRNGVNFSVYSRDASGVELLLFDREDNASPARVIPLDPFINRSYHYWHIFLPGVQGGQIYGYRVRGPFSPSKGMRFDDVESFARPIWSWSRCSPELLARSGSTRGRQRNLLR